MTETVPATGVISVVSTGSVAVAPSDSTSVVTVAPAGRLVVKLSVPWVGLARPTAKLWK